MISPHSDLMHRIALKIVAVIACPGNPPHLGLPASKLGGKASTNLGASQFIERLRRTIKYREVYLRAHASVSAARASIGHYHGFYNGRRPHSSLGEQTPDQAYLNALTPIPAAE
jgi:hypothetical protein